MMATSSSAVRDTISKLIDVCRDGQFGFGLAAKGVGNPILRAELLQYSFQREEFAAELHEALQSMGDDVNDEPALASLLHHGWAELRRAIANGDRAAILADCDTHDVEGIDVYRQAFASGLPQELAGLVYMQFQAIARVQGRLHSLRETASPS